MSSRHSDRNYGKPLYQEVIRWSFWLWAFVIFMDLSILLAIWAALPIIATWITLVILIALTTLAFVKTALRITVTQGWFLVGNAAIERAFIFNFKVLNSGEMKRARGVEAHPLDFLAIRFWVSQGIKASLRDPRDKTPNWIISSKNGAKLVAVLENPEH